MNRHGKTPMNRHGKTRVVKSVKGKHGTIRRSYWVSSGAQKPGHIKMLKSVSGEHKGARLGTVFGAAAGAVAGGAVGIVGGALIGAHSGHRALGNEFRRRDPWNYHANQMSDPNFVRQHGGKIAGIIGTVAAQHGVRYGAVGMAGGAATGAVVGRAVGRAIGRRMR